MISEILPADGEAGPINTKLEPKNLEGREKQGENR